jgi:hypothetical protein
LLRDVAYLIENDLADGRPQIQKIKKESAMTSHKKVAYLILLSSLTVSSVPAIHAQLRTTTTTPKYTPPPAPRQVSRPEPEPQQRRPEPEPEQRRIEPETRQQYTPRDVQPENRPYNNAQSESRPDPSLRHTNVNVVRPQVVTPALRHAMTYNTRPNGVHILPDYFAGHFGATHGFHFIGWGPGCPTCGFTPFHGEWYFNWNGANFGLMGQIPGNWALATDYLYVDIGDDGNYYLYDTQFPDLAVQLTFVQNLGDDQAGADQD